MTRLLAELADDISVQLHELARLVFGLQAEQMSHLEGDTALLDGLFAGTYATLEALVGLLRRGPSVGQPAAPHAAQEFARLLAHRGTAPNALVRVYRLFQESVLGWAFRRISEREADPHVALEASRRFLEVTFRCVDDISDQVISTYETERDRVASSRSSLRAAVLAALLGDGRVELAAAESALGYRLARHHLGVIVSARDCAGASRALAEGERTLSRVATALGSSGRPLFVPRDQFTAWGWVSWDHGPGLTDEAEQQRIDVVLAREAGDVTVALGTSAEGLAGFRTTHLDALRAHSVASAAGPRAPRVTAFSDPGVRTASLFASDLDAARRLVARSLGALAADTAGAARLRDTLLTFIREKGSFVATAERMHLHRNTVKYRVDKALAERGRDLDDERLELELALVCCHWLGPPVLAPV